MKQIGVMAMVLVVFLTGCSSRSLKVSVRSTEGDLIETENDTGTESYTSEVEKTVLKVKESIGTTETESAEESSMAEPETVIETQQVLETESPPMSKEVAETVIPTEAQSTAFSEILPETTTASMVPPTTIPQTTVPETPLPPATTVPPTTVPVTVTSTEASETTPPATEAPTTVPEIIWIDTAGYAEQVVQLINRERTARGLNALEVDAELMSYAFVRASECAVLFSHERPGGVPALICTEGSKLWAYSENCHLGGDPSVCIAGWISSPMHLSNILSDGTHIGVGCFQDADGVLYYTAEFGLAGIY